MKKTIQKHSFFFFRSIGIHFCEKFLNPWKEFRKWIPVFADQAKNASEEAPFLLVRFLLSPTSTARGRHNKENEQENCSRLPVRPGYSGGCSNRQNIKNIAS